MRVLGLINRVEQLEQKEDGREPLTVLNIEGLSILAKPDVAKLIPERGEVMAIVSVQWRSGKAPLFWLQDVED